MTTVLLIIAGVVFGLVSLLMIVAILLQESKGGGLAALGGTRAESAFGASNPLRRMTVVLSVIFFLVAGGLTLALRRKSVHHGEKPKPATVETVPVPADANGKAPAEEPAKDASKEAPKEAPKDAATPDAGKAAEGAQAEPKVTTEAPPAPATDAAPKSGTRTGPETDK